MNSLLASRRSRLVLLLAVATAAISVLAFQAAGPALSFYLTPAEYLADPRHEGTRVRVAGRVVDGSIVEVAGRPVQFEIFGDEDDRLTILFERGVVPNLFGPYALVVAEGIGRAGGVVEADSIIIKHEDEFWADVPPADSISSHFVRPEKTEDEMPAGSGY